MTEKEILQIFKEEKALLSGHFLLSSGLHSPQYMQCALLLQKPALGEKLCKALAGKLKGLKIQTVVGPALGGILVSYGLARALAARSLFAERVEGVFTLRRGFVLQKNERVVVAEDVVTTGKSTQEIIELVQKSGAKMVGVASLVDRSGGENPFTQPFKTLLKISIQTYPPETCPLCRQGKIPLTKPGSRC